MPARCGDGAEVRRARARGRRRAKDLIQSNIAVLHKTADVLMEREQIDGEEFQRIVMDAQAEQYLKADEPGVGVPYKDPVPA